VVQAIAVALERHGDRAAATATYEKARARSRGRARQLIDLAIARLATAPTDSNPAILADAVERDARVRAVVERIEAAAPPVLRLPPRRAIRARYALTGLVLAVAAAVAIGLGCSSDLGVVIRAGAEVHGAIAGGQWWRLVTCVVLHIGALHLLLNASGLFVLGRICEDVFGAARTIAVFGVAGLAGSIASYLGSPAGVSAGASGAVLGLLGAVLVELTLHRAHYRAAWKRGMWGALVIVGVGQIAYGFAYQVVDQWAHVAGLVAGGALGAALSPHVRWARLGLWAARGLVVGLLGLLGVAGALAITTPLAEAFAHGPAVRRAIGGVSIALPADWLVEADGAYQPDQIIMLRAARRPREDAPRQIAAWLAAETRSIRQEQGDARWAIPPVVALPDGWVGYELATAPEDELGARQAMRTVLAARVSDHDVVFIEIWAPESVARGAARFVAALIASSGPA